MGFDSVPWFVGGGAQHSPEIARVLAYAAFRGNEGVMGPPDLRVTALTVPGASVNIAPGACSVLCRALGQTYQAYAGRLPTQDTVGIAATGSGSGRSDLIVARVEDPNLAGEPWSAPTDVAAGPYIFIRVIPGVPNTTTTVTGLGLGYSAIPLARIDIPASTATITNAMLVDLRTIPNPRKERSLRTSYPAGSQDLSSQTTLTNWPSAANTTLTIPTWATTARIVAQVAGVNLLTANWNGALRVALYPTSGSPAVTQETNIDLNYGGSYSREYIVAAGEIAIPAALRGQTVTAKFEGRMVVRTGAAALRIDTGSTTVLDVEFVESASAV